MLSAAVSNPFVDSVASFSLEGVESEPVSLFDSVLVDVVDAAVDASVDASVDAVVDAVVDAAVVVAVLVSEHPLIEKVESTTNKVPADRDTIVRGENWFENLNL